MLQAQKADPILDSVGQLMDDMEPALLDFIKANVTSFIKWDLITLLCKNRYTKRTLKFPFAGIAKRVKLWFKTPR